MANETILTTQFWDRLSRKIDSGAPLLDKLSPNQLYELVDARNKELLPRYGVVRHALSGLSPAFAAKVTSQIKAYDKREGRKAVKNVTSFEFDSLYQNLTFDLTTLLSGASLDKFMKNVSKSAKNSTGSKSVPSQIEVQRLRRKFKRDNGIL